MNTINDEDSNEVSKKYKISENKYIFSHDNLKDVALFTFTKKEYQHYSLHNQSSSNYSLNFMVIKVKKEKSTEQKCSLISQWLQLRHQIRPMRKFPLSPHR